MNRDFVTALLQLNAEKQVPRDQLIHTVEDAIQSAYRRQPGDEDVCVRIDGETGKVRVFRAKIAVGEITDPLTEFGLDEAKVFNPAAVLGDLVEIEEMDPNSFGRIHAQTAKQVVLQRLREAERDVAFDQFASRDGELITGTVNRIEPRAIILELVGQGGIARAEAILATTEQSPLEHYRIGQNVKALVLEVRRGLRGPQLFISRSHKNFLRRLFELEVPDSEVPVNGVPDAFAQLLDKLAENARDFAPDGTPVRITLAVAARRALLAVQNAGPPLPASMLAGLFGSMVSVRDAPPLASAPRGTAHLGLGLHVVRLVAEAHGGRVSATNLARGAGVRFEVEIPLAG